MAILVCNGCDTDSEPYEQTIVLRPEVGTHFLPPTPAPSDFRSVLQTKNRDPLQYLCPRCQANPPADWLTRNALKPE